MRFCLSFMQQFETNKEQINSENKGNNGNRIKSLR